MTYGQRFGASTAVLIDFPRRDGTMSADKIGDAEMLKADGTL